jgi:hypothetical protein
MAKKGTPPSGILYRSPTGDLWFLFNSWDHPRKVTNAALKRAFSAHAKKAAPKDLIGNTLPQEMLDILEDLFEVTLLGAWWVWGP